jgi:hypothetical protein
LERETGRGTLSLALSQRERGLDLERGFERERSLVRPS